MNELFEYNNSGPNTRTGGKFLRPNVNKVYKGVQTPLGILDPLSGIRCYPNAVKLCTNLLTFKTAIKSWVPSNCPCRLCIHHSKDQGFAQIYD